MRIDAHQHFWHYTPERDTWISGEMAVLRRDFLPSDLAPLLEKHGFDGCVAVQADQSEEETQFLLSLASGYPFIKGVVGWIDLAAPDLEKKLEKYQQHTKLKGFRQIWQHGQPRDLMLSPPIKKGIGQLAKFDVTYDLLIFPDQLPFCTQLAAQFPAQKFVVDHLAKPAIRSRQMEDWKTGIKAMAHYPQVSCKLSGMVTEAAWKGWTEADFRPYMDVVMEAFGIDRILFGSDWPVCLLAASYADVCKIAESYFSGFTADEKNKLFGGNAVRFYNLSA